ncbi:hypothetical protein D9M71_454670 [compost metagenome]
MRLPPGIVRVDDQPIPGQVQLSRVLNGIAVPVAPERTLALHRLQLRVTPGGIAGAQVGLVDHPGTPYPTTGWLPAIVIQDGVIILAKVLQGEAVASRLGDDCI